MQSNPNTTTVVTPAHRSYGSTHQLTKPEISELNDILCHVNLTDYRTCLPNTGGSTFFSAAIK